MRTLVILTAYCFLLFARISQAQIDPDIECAICLNNLYDTNEDVITLACHKTHSFHISCLNNWFKKKPSSTCPLCRDIKYFTENRDMHFASYVVQDSDENVNCGCIKLFTDLLRIYE